MKARDFFDFFGPCPEITIWILAVPILVAALVVFGVKEMIWPSPKKPQPTEQEMQDKREDAYHKTGKAVRRFIDGVME